MLSTLIGAEMDQNVYNYIQGLSSSVFLFGLLILAWSIFIIALMLKVWQACNDIGDMKKIVDDAHFRECARYESDKRHGVITASDLDAAEKLVAK